MIDIFMILRMHIWYTIGRFYFLNTTTSDSQDEIDVFGESKKITSQSRILFCYVCTSDH